MTLDIRRYYTQVRSQAERVSPGRWDTFVVGNVIAQQVKEKLVFDTITSFKLVSNRAFESLHPYAESSIKEGNVSEDTRKLVTEVTETPARVAATKLVRDVWTRRILDGELPVFQILEPDLQRYPRAILKPHAGLAGKLLKKPNIFTRDV